VLSQGPVGHDLPVAYVSRSLNNAATHYTTSEKELLATVWATKYFRPYLYGQRFKTVSDHKPLVWVMNVKDPDQGYFGGEFSWQNDYEITYRCGSQNTNADALSRIGSVIKEDDSSDEFDEDRKKKILYEFHDSPVGGHTGMNKTYRAIKSQYSWPNMRREVEEYIKQCRGCQVNKMLTPKHKAPMEMTTAEHPWQVLPRYCGPLNCDTWEQQIHFNIPRWPKQICGSRTHWSTRCRNDSQSVCGEHSVKIRHT